MPAIAKFQQKHVGKSAQTQYSRWFHPPKTMWEFCYRHSITDPGESNAYSDKQQN